MRRDRVTGFTLTELLVVIGILSVLMVLMVPQFSKILPKADRIVCISHLRELWLYFAPCASESAGWPQVPKGVKIGSLQEQRFWLDYSSNNLGVPAKMWHCPSVDRASAGAPLGDQPLLIHYLPTLFDARPGTPNRWPSMPWFSEMGNVHGEGNLIIRADGAVMPSTPLQ